MPSLHPAAPSALFLTRIFRELDAELFRLQTARDQIAAVVALRPASHLPELLAEAEPEPATAPAPQAAPRQAAPRGRPRGSRNRFPSARRVRRPVQPEPRALTSSLPVGPVVVSPAELARKREAQQAAVVAAHPAKPSLPAFDGSLESLIREVEQRRSAA